MTTLADYRDVGDHAALERAGLFVVEGRLVVERLLEDGRYRIHSVLVTPTAAQALEETLAKRPDVPVLFSDQSEIAAMTGYQFHRGCLALAHRRETALSIDELAQATRVLAIEGVGNPDNIGGLFRTALALDVEAILLDRSAADPLYRKATRTSMGATLRVPYSRVEDLPAVLGELRSRGVRVAALTPHPEAVCIDDVRIDPATRLVLAVGSEGHGLTTAAFAHADVRVRIPVDPRADSLNVVVAAAIALHALRPR
jgi:tRNA G18 (ribose-2'-O)-methylase SpoU